MKHFSLYARVVVGIVMVMLGGRVYAQTSVLSASAAFATEVYLSWQGAAKAGRVTVQRSTDGRQFSNIAALDAQVTTYTDAGVAPATTYYYRLLAPDGSVASNEVEAQTTIALITDANAVFLEPEVHKPAYLTAWKDPVFGTRVTRIANDPGTAFVTTNNGDGSWGSDARHHYQLVQPWSADGVLYAIENKADDGGRNGGAGGSVLLLDTKRYLPWLGMPSHYPQPGADVRWNPDPSYAHTFIAVGKKAPELFWFDLGKESVTRQWHLPFAPKEFGGEKGNVSQDGRFVLLMDKQQRKMVVVDMNPQPPYAPYPSPRIGPVYDLETRISGLDYSKATASVDPSGKYVVVHYGVGGDRKGNYMRVYDINPATLALNLHAMPPDVVQCAGKASDSWIYSLGHYDLALNPYDHGEPVAVGQEECGNVRKRIAAVAVVDDDGIGHVVMVRLRDGAVTSLTDPGNGKTIPLEAYAHHVSAQNTQLPGWVFVSYGAWPGEANERYYDEIIALSMDGKQRVQRLAHLHSDFHDFTHHGCASGDKDFNYRSESHAVPSADGKRIAFASNWLIAGKGTGGCSIQDYMIDLRP